MKGFGFTIIGCLVGIGIGRAIWHRPDPSPLGTQTLPQDQIRSNSERRSSKTVESAGQRLSISADSKENTLGPTGAISSQKASDSPPLVESKITFTQLKELEKRLHERQSEFVEQNDEIWANACKPGSKHPFEPELVVKSAGKYEGTMSYTLQSNLKVVDYRVVLEIGSGGKTDSWKFEFLPSGSNGSFSSSGTGFPCSIGTDSSQNVLSLAIFNSMSNEWAEASYFGFKIPSSATKGESNTSALFGLTEDLVWRQIGTIQLKRTLIR